MTRHLVALGLVALALPALGQGYGEPEGGAWGDEYAPAGAYEAPPQPYADVDVSVEVAAPGASVSFSTFREGLASYGQWFDVPRYGRVWRPAHVAAGWRPYYYGRWEWTDEGWLWVSDEPWGWAVYHYGRWSDDPYYGWIWVPGYQWAPAWVTWRYGPEYVGWAPLAPGFSVAISSYPVSLAWWTFVPCARFAGVPVYRVAYSHQHAPGIFRATQPAPPRAHVHGGVAAGWGGPARPFVEHRMGRPIVPARVRPVASPSAAAAPAREGVVPIYRPAPTPAPARSPMTTSPAPWRPSTPAPGRPPAAAPARRWGAPSASSSSPADVRRPQSAAPGWRPPPPSAGSASTPSYVPPPQGHRPAAPGPAAAAPRMSSPPGHAPAGAPVQRSPASVPVPRGGAGASRGHAPAPAPTAPRGP